MRKMFELSLVGWQDALKEFGLSLLKTMIAAALVFLIGEVDKLQAFILANPENQLAYYGGGIPLVRAILTSGWVQITRTSSSVVPVEQATEHVEEVPVDTNPGIPVG